MDGWDWAVALAWWFAVSALAAVVWVGAYLAGVARGRMVEIERQIDESFARMNESVARMRADAEAVQRQQGSVTVNGIQFPRSES